MDRCTVGILANMECHKTWHATSTKLLALKSVDHMEEILWRAGLRSAQFDKETATICSHHLHVFEKYSTKYVTCSNTFGSQKKKLKKPTSLYFIHNLSMYILSHFDYLSV